MSWLSFTRPGAAPPKVGAVLTAAAIALFAAVAWQGAASATPTAPTAPTAKLPVSPAPPTAGARYKPADCNQPPAVTSSTKHYAQCMALIATDAKGAVVPNAAAPPAGALGPADIQSAYNLPAGGQGQTVAIVDAYGYTNAEADLAVFRSHYALPACTTANGCFTKVDQNGGTNYPPDNSGWALETALDLDAVSSACPACHILLVEGDDADTDSLGTAVDTAVALGAMYVSNSYGVPGEMPDEQAADHYYNHPGVAVVAASGDWTETQQPWPATNPNVVAVGGTYLLRDSSQPRGWLEKAWELAGSGCSLYEPKPDYQLGIDTQCGKRAIADISADAAPATGLSVYDTIGQSGWLQVGGTSLASPLVAAMYALAGTPVAGTYPVTYPYQAPAASLNDVTQGSNGSCGTVLCNAGPGWDGPTGLGTPYGVAALRGGPHGTIAGTVTAAATGHPLDSVTVSISAGDSVFSAQTDASGHYARTVATGSYDLTTNAFGYLPKTASGVVVSEDTTTTADFALTASPSAAVSGAVTDGSGHGWPLYAKLTFDNDPGGAVYTDPFTGRYELTLPVGFSTVAHVTPLVPGYTTATSPLTVGSDGTGLDVSVPVDAASCAAAGYHTTYSGIGTDFTTWTGDTARDGWTQVDGNGNGVWRFDDRTGRPSPPGGDEHFAILDAGYFNGPAPTKDAALVSPVVNLSAATDKTIQFDTTYLSDLEGGATADVDISLDGGATWTNYWHTYTDPGSGHDGYVSGHQVIDLPTDADLSTTRVRFHFTGRDSDFLWWSVDNVAIGGARACLPAEGGLVSGFVTDTNTGAAVNDAKVTSADNGQFAASLGTPGDPDQPDGFYQLFNASTGQHAVTASDGSFTPATATVTVSDNLITRKDFALKAGHLTVDQTGVSLSATLGQTKTAQVTLKNDGTAPVHVKLGEHNGAFTPPEGASTPSSTLSPDGSRWTYIADYPFPVWGNMVADHNGKVYSVGGSPNPSTPVSDGYVFDPAAGSWSRIANLPDAVDQGGAAFLGDTMYVVGGWKISANSGVTTSGVYAYDPAANTWSPMASLPINISAESVVTLDGYLYVVGGCTTFNCAPNSRSVWRYDPGSNSWTAVADYPTAVSFASCAGLIGEIVCTGGVLYDPSGGQTSTTSTYIYNPDTNSWSPGADAPLDVWGAVTSDANGKLQVAGGVIDQSSTISNQTIEYDPSSNTWAALPNLNLAVYRGGGACGYKVGGLTSDGGRLTAEAEGLPGKDQCGDSGRVDVPWLSESTTEFDLAPGASTTVTVSADSSALSQPGGYSGLLVVGTDSPYTYAPVGVSLTVNPPKSWGEISGVVTDAATGAPIAGATVLINTMGGPGAASYPLTTDANGHYQWWLDQRNNPLQLIVTKNGYASQVKTVKISKGGNTTVNIALGKPDPSPIPTHGHIPE